MRPTKITRSALILTAALMAASPALANGPRPQQQQQQQRYQQNHAPAQGRTAHTAQANHGSKDVGEAIAIIGVLGLLAHALK